LAWAAAVVPSWPRDTVKVLPDTEVTSRISWSISRRKLPEDGKPAALATLSVVAPAVSAAVSVLWALLAYCSGTAHPWLVATVWRR
jgi:hypothetical protein